MDLREYLFYQRMTITEFSRKIGYTNQYIGRVIHRQSIPGYRAAKFISDATNNNVTMEELLKPLTAEELLRPLRLKKSGCKKCDEENNQKEKNNNDAIAQ